MGDVTKLEPRRKKKAAKCPICGRPPEARYKPFCSRRCADTDLSRWLGGAYRVPTDEKPEDMAEINPESKEG